MVCGVGGRQVMVPRLVEGGCLYYTLDGPGSIPVGPFERLMCYS